MGYTTHICSVSFGKLIKYTVIEFPKNIVVCKQIGCHFSVMSEKHDTPIFLKLKFLWNFSDQLMELRLGSPNHSF